jgi:hypothetical protein
MQAVKLTVQVVIAEEKSIIVELLAIFVIAASYAYETRRSPPSSSSSASGERIRTSDPGNEAQDEGDQGGNAVHYLERKPALPFHIGRHRASIQLQHV